MNRQRVGMSNALESQIKLLLYRAWVLKGMLGGNGVPVGTFYTCLPVREKRIAQGINRRLADASWDKNGAFQTTRMFGVCSYFKAFCWTVVCSLLEVPQHEIAWLRKM